MSLVAYGSSEESEEDSNDVAEEAVPVAPVNGKQLSASKTESLFSTLPAPIQSDKIDSNINARQPVKISIPSLSAFKDEEDLEVPSKKMKPSSKGSGLFALLPAPKNMSVKETKRPLVPHVLSKNKETNSVMKQVKPIIPNPVASAVNDISDSDEEEVFSSSDFFKLSEPDPPADVPVYETHSVIDNTHVESDIDNQNLREKEVTCPQDESFIPFSNDSLELNEEAIKKLVGRRRGKDVPLNLIDVSGEEIMPDAKEWMVKQLTEEKPLKSNSHRKKDGPSTQQKRKHQITYLAYQAKEQELELQNQWASNRLSKKQTQSKYGF